MIKYKERARQRLRESVYAGLIKKPSNCSICKKKLPRKKIHGHHHAGYKRWWDVQWVCMKCHDDIEPTKARFGKKNGMAKNPHLSSFSKNNPKTKITIAQAEEIRKLAKTARRQEIADKYGITLRNVFYIISGATRNSQ